MSPPACVPLPRLAGSHPRRRALISLTPLIDVVFILLMFFMLASSFMDWRAIELNVPQQAAGSTMEGSLLVEVRADGVRLSGQTLSPAALAERVAERLQEDPQRAVLVKPAAGVPLQQTIRVLDRLVAAGATNLSVIRDPEQ